MKNTASEFAKWLYLLKQRDESDENQRMADGIDLEEGIHRLANEGILFNKIVGSCATDGFCVEYNGMSTGNEETLFSSALSILGKPMACKPDLILENRLGKVIIIENKYTNHKLGLPWNGWVNNQGQLWCYSQIDKYVGCDVMLILQFWNFDNFRKPVILPPRRFTKEDLAHIAGLFQTYKEVCEQGGDSGTKQAV
jgi:hypothetical protein